MDADVTPVYTKIPTSKRNGLAASEMVTRAQTKPTTRLQIAFVSQVEGLRVLTKGNDQGLPMGTVEDSTSLAEGLKSMAEELQVPEEWVNSLREQYAAYPEGERCFYEIPEGRFARRPPTLTRVWIVDVSGAPDASQTTTKPPHLPEMKWTPLDAIEAPFVEKESPLSLRYRQELREATSKTLLGPMQTGIPNLVGAITGKQLPNTRQPWLVDYEDLPPPPPSPRHIRRLKRTVATRSLIAKQVMRSFSTGLAQVSQHENGGTLAALSLTKVHSLRHRG